MSAISNPARLVWLRRLLLLKAALCFFLWGLPALAGTARFLALFGIAVPEDPLPLRLFGSLVIAFGVAYYLASRDPVRNRAIVLAGIVDNGLATLTILALSFTAVSMSWFVWLSAALTGLCCIGFAVLLPPQLALGQAPAARATD